MHEDIEQKTLQTLVQFSDSNVN